MEARPDYPAVRRGWCLGSEGFRQELLAAAVERVGASPDGSDRREMLSLTQPSPQGEGFAFCVFCCG